MFRKTYQILSSKELAAILFACICFASIPGTFTDDKSSYSTPVFRAILWLAGINLTACTLLRLKTLSKPVIIMHCGVLLTLAGAVVSSYGFVATVNIYEGTKVDKVYRWDSKEDASIGMDITLKKVNVEYYPIPVQVGVLKGKEKVGLFTLRTGEGFRLDDYFIRIDALEFPAENLKIGLFRQGNIIGYFETSGNRRLPQDFPYEFVLVAYKNPALKRTWVDLMLSSGDEILAEGASEVNSPFKRGNLKFHHVSIDRDQYGINFAGIQIVSDPGRPYVFSGFCIIGVGTLLYLIRRLYGHKRHIVS